MHTSSAVCLKRDSDVLFNDEEIIVSAADNCNRLQVKKREPHERLLDLSIVRLRSFSFPFSRAPGAKWQDWIRAVADAGDVLQDPVYVSLQAAVCCGPGPGGRHRAGRDLVVLVSISTQLVSSDTQ